jgi:hypothetical protein
MNQAVKRNIVLLVCILLFGGCAEMRLHSPEPVKHAEGNFDLDVTNYLLSCLNDISDMGTEEFAVNFKKAEGALQHGWKQDTLRFICLSLHADADYKQFRQGAKTLEQYISEHPNSSDDIKGFQILVDRLDVEIMTKWSAWKSLLDDKKELKAEVESLQERFEQDQIIIDELHKQIEQLKNIENIIESREAEQP